MREEERGERRGRMGGEREREQGWKREREERGRERESSRKERSSYSTSPSLFPGSSVTVVLVHLVATVPSLATRLTRRQRAVKTVNLRHSNRIRTLAQINIRVYLLRNKNKTRRHRNDVIMTSLSPPPTHLSFRSLHDTYLPNYQRLN